jgi:hypothetical protein
MVSSSLLACHLVAKNNSQMVNSVDLVYAGALQGAVADHGIKWINCDAVIEPIDYLPFYTGPRLLCYNYWFAPYLLAPERERISVHPVRKPNLASRFYSIHRCMMLMAGHKAATAPTCQPSLAQVPCFMVDNFLPEFY